MAHGYGNQAAVDAPLWRTRDIVVAAVIGVAFGVAFVAFGVVWRAVEFLGFAQNLFYAVWLMPAIVGAMVIRKPGAALFCEMVAAGLSALLGSQWGPDTLLSGFVQGAAAELFKAWAATVRSGLGVLDGEIVMCLHDELVVHVPAEHTDAAAQLLLDALAATTGWWAAGSPVRFVAEVASGESWAAAH